MLDFFELEGLPALLIVDSNSNYSEVIPTPGESSDYIVSALAYWQARFGKPRFIYSDNASVFHSDRLQSYLEKEVLQLHSPAYDPPANGLAEAYVRVYKTTAKVLVEQNPDTHWASHLPKIMERVNMLPTKRTKIAPREVAFRHKERPAFQFPSTVLDLKESTHVSGLFKAGDLVLKLDHRSKRFEGIFQIEKLLGPDRYLLHGNPATIGARDLKPIQSEWLQDMLPVFDDPESEEFTSENF